jgi:beta-glucanase (GH16 family)
VARNIAVKVGYIPSAPVPDPVGQSAGVWTNILNDEFTSAMTVTDATNGLVNFGGPTWRAWYPDGPSFLAQSPGGAHTNNVGRELEYYDTTGLSTSGGILSLTARNFTTVSGLPYTSGMIQSNPTLNFLHGYAEARMLSPQINSVWPAFWMIPADYSWPPEIDIMEQQGGGGGRLSASLWSAQPMLNQTFPTVDLSQWHVWGVKWTASEVTFFIDGTQVWTVTDATRIPTKSMYVVVNHAVDGSGTVTAGNYPLSVQVDYVRVWQ